MKNLNDKLIQFLKRHCYYPQTKTSNLTEASQQPQTENGNHQVAPVSSSGDADGISSLGDLEGELKDQDSNVTEEVKEDKVDIVNENDRNQEVDKESGENSVWLISILLQQFKRILNID